MVVRRVEQWPAELSAFLRDRRTMPFQYGVNDCLLFPADAVFRMSGVDFAAPWRGKYETEEQAKAILADNGGVQVMITDALGFKGTKSLLTAKRGDVVMANTKWGVMGGIVDDTGQRVAVPMTGDECFIRLPLNLAWRVWSW